MRRFWKRLRLSEVERRLAARRQRPRPEFVKAQAAAVRPATPTRWVTLRAAFAAALAVAMLVFASAFGGLGYAGSAADGLVRVAKAVDGSASKRKPARAAATGYHHPGDDQYNEERRRCRQAVLEEHRAFHRRQTAEHNAFHRQQTAEHNAFHKRKPKPSTNAHKAFHDRQREEHKEFHDQQRDDHRAFHEYMKEALERCNEIGR